MDGYYTDKKYESLKIPDRRQGQEDGAAQALPQAKTHPHTSLPDGLYYEIEYDSCSIPGVGKFVLKAQKIEPPEKDEVRELFHQMRDIAREDRSLFSAGSRFFDQKTRQENAKIFYKQGLFMKDFTDRYAEPIPYSSYFPYYQMMGYEQLRTYFTWRTEVRKGNVAQTSLSYAFLYIYELLNNIGADNPQDGLDQLMSFWKAFRVYDKTIDRYILRWLKDYHIYYGLPQSFKAFADKNGLTQHYPKMADMDNRFDLFCAISKYDIRKSAFFAGDNAKLSTDCFYCVIGKLRQVFIENGIDFEESIFQPTKKISVWTPFKDALFYPWMKQTDRRVVLSENEIYICSRNKWTFSTILTTESGRQLIGYVMKQMESALRKAVKYKFKLSANVDAVTHAAVGKLNEAGLSLETIVSDAVAAFYREATKTVVRVDRGALTKIRQEALATQEKLIVTDGEEQIASVAVPLDLNLPAFPDMPPMLPPDHEPAPMSDAWEGFKNALTATEIEALSAALHGETEIRKFAGECGMMPEVLVDGINGKAMDFIGDSLMDEEFFLYDDYRDQLKELVGCVW
jgi:hypothetical protein